MMKKISIFAVLLLAALVSVSYADTQGNGQQVSPTESLTDWNNCSDTVKHGDTTTLDGCRVMECGYGVLREISNTCGTQKAAPNCTDSVAHGGTLSVDNGCRVLECRYGALVEISDCDTTPRELPGCGEDVAHGETKTLDNGCVLECSYGMWIQDGMWVKNLSNCLTSP